MEFLYYCTFFNICGISYIAERNESLVLILKVTLLIKLMNFILNSFSYLYVYKM